LPTRPGDPPPSSPPGAPPPYRLPGPLSQRGELPVAAGASRIPRALRAFNGMAPTPEDSAASVPRANVRGRQVPVRGRSRDGLTIRDLLEEPSTDQAEEGRLDSLRSALGRLRRAASGRPAD
jgi:hypothetical protein